MVSRIFLEGGGDSNELRTRCREGFRKLLERCGYAGRMPRLIASGGRKTAFSDFKTAHDESGSVEFIAMLIDSEDPVDDTEKTWAHLRARDNWSRAANAGNEQVLLMTTCMETWIVCDRNALSKHYGTKLQSQPCHP